MRIFKLRPQLLRGDFAHRVLWPPEGTDWLRLWRFDCGSKAADWPKAGAIVQELCPQKPRSNFPIAQLGMLALDRLAYDALNPTFGGLAEELPLLDGSGERYTLLNFIRCSSCIDAEASVWKGSGKVFQGFERHVFVPERLPEQSIFKDAKEWMEIFVTEGHLPEEREFKAVAERNDLRGLQFEEVWSSD